MHITSLHLNGYRNIQDIILAPSFGTNIILGQNAQGKTNLLEAIYLCAFGKSHRTTNDKELVNFNETSATVKCYFNKNDVFRNVTVNISGNKKRIIMDSNAIKKRSELIGNISCVLFCPDDLNLIKGSPVERRRYMDRCLSQIYPKYFSLISTYYEILKNRNADLKQGGKTLDVWDEQLSKAASLVNKYRFKFIKDISPIVLSIHRSIIMSENVELSLSINEEFCNSDEVLAQFKKNRERDLRYTSTQFGPHRDDILITLNKKNSKLFASQGQQRSIALSLKMAELELIRKVTSDTPILLLDDVMSELDRNRQKRLIRRLEGIQSFITTTHIDFSHNGDIYTMKRGSII